MWTGPESSIRMNKMRYFMREIFNDWENAWREIEFISNLSRVITKFECRCFSLLQRETSRDFLVTRFMEEMSCVFLFTFFFTIAHFHPGGRLHFSFSHRRHKNFMLLLQQKVSPWFFFLALALFLVELSWPVALLSLFLCPSLSLFSKFVDMTINLHVIL